MFTMTIPPEPPATELMVIAQATPTQRAPNVDYVVKECQEVEHASSQSDNGNMLSTAIFLARLLKLKDDALDAHIRLDVPPVHGQLLRIAYTSREQLPNSQTSWTTVYANSDGTLPVVPPDTDKVKYFKPAGEEYRYVTTPGFYGKDRAIFSVEYKGKRYRIDLELIVADFFSQTDEGSPCTAPRLIRIIPMRPDSNSINATTDQSSTGESLDFRDVLLRGGGTSPLLRSKEILSVKPRAPASPWTPTLPATAGSSTPPPRTTRNTSPPATPTNG